MELPKRKLDREGPELIYTLSETMYNLQGTDD